MMTSLNVIMTDRVVTVKPQTTLRELVGILRDENVSGAPVVSEDRVIGVVSATDLIDFEVDAPYEGPAPGWEAPREDETPTSYFTSWEGSIDVLERFHRLEEPEWDRLMEHTVAEVMTPAIWALSPDEDVRSAAQYMMRRGIHRVLVMQDDELLGIVSAMDIVRAVALDLL